MKTCLNALHAAHGALASQQQGVAENVEAYLKLVEESLLNKGTYPKIEYGHAETDTLLQTFADMMSAKENRLAVQARWKVDNPGKGRAPRSERTKDQQQLEVYIYECVWAYVCVCACMHVCVCACLCVCVCLCAHLSMSVFVYIYIL